ncbi:MAG: hypothetical protein GX458_07210 [Phyllobacteriaceae bacterium]|nr:hypothetical protein [Phyllobacteriaceae bacterium]
MPNSPANPSPANPSPARPSRVYAALSGAFGGASVPFVKLLAAGVTVGAYGPSAPQILDILPAAVLFGFLGAGVVAAVGAETLFAALVLGASAPGFLNSAYNGVVTGRETTPLRQEAPAVVRGSSIWGLVATAHAEEEAPSASPSTPVAPAGAAPPAVRILVTPEIVGGVPKQATLPVEAERKTPGGTVEKIPLGAVDAASGPVEITLPPGTNRLTVGGSSLELPSNVGGSGRVGVTVTTEPKPGSDFFWALGGRREFDVRSVGTKLF